MYLHMHVILSSKTCFIFKNYFIYEMIDPLLTITFINFDDLKIFETIPFAPNILLTDILG